jgi:hypothetical protein
MSDEIVGHDSNTARIALGIEPVKGKNAKADEIVCYGSDTAKIALGRPVNDKEKKDV